MLGSVTIINEPERLLLSIVIIPLRPSLMIAPKVLVSFHIIAVSHFYKLVVICFIVSTFSPYCLIIHVWPAGQSVTLFSVKLRDLAAQIFKCIRRTREFSSVNSFSVSFLLFHNWVKVTTLVIAKQVIFLCCITYTWNLTFSHSLSEKGHTFSHSYKHTNTSHCHKTVIFGCQCLLSFLSVV